MIVKKKKSVKSKAKPSSNKVKLKAKNGASKAKEVASKSKAKRGRKIKHDKPKTRRIKKIIEAIGGASNIAKVLGISSQSVYYWIRVGTIPAEIAVKIVKEFGEVNGINEQDIRPDLWSKKRWELKKACTKSRKSSKKQ
jgi:DNA-binding transcriptional regulator YdaS (Cro superfamily)